jgi:hypothetical protein
MTIEELAKLSDEELRVRCAEVLGANTKHARFWHLGHGGWRWWEFQNREDAERYHSMFGVPEHPVQEFTRPEWLPNYPADLNAMHEAEGTMTEEECKDFNHALMDAKPPRREIKTFAERWTWGSTARQRCIAFIAVKQQPVEVKGGGE